MSVRPLLHLSLTTLYTLDLTRWSPSVPLGDRAMPWHEEDLSAEVVTSGQADACLLQQVAAYEGVKPRDLRARCGRGSRCIALARDGEVMSFCWTSSGRERIGESECDLELPPGIVYIWDCATLPPYRGRGLYSALLQHIVAELQRASYQRVWIGSSWSNHASRRGIVKAGFEHVATLTHLCLGPWRINRLVSTATASPELAQLTCHLARIPTEKAVSARLPLKLIAATLCGMERRHFRN